MAETVVFALEFSALLASAGAIKPNVSNANAIPSTLFILLPLYSKKLWSGTLPFFWREPDLLIRHSNRVPGYIIRYIFFDSILASISFNAGSLTNTFA